jgi:hypothetical protein
VGQCGIKRDLMAQVAGFRQNFAVKKMGGAGLMAA